MGHKYTFQNQLDLQNEVFIGAILNWRQRRGGNPRFLISSKVSFKRFPSAVLSLLDFYTTLARHSLTKSKNKSGFVNF